MQHQILKAAIVPRFQFPAPGPEKPSTPEEWFVNQYQMIRAFGQAAAPKVEPPTAPQVAGSRVK